MDMKKLLVRSLSGLVYIGIIIGCIFWGVFPFTWMAAAFGAIAVIEFEKITHELHPQTIPALLLDISGVVCLAFSWMLFPVFIWVFIILCRMIMELYLKSGSPLSNLSRSFMTQVYIGIPLGMMVCIGEWWNLHLVLAIFMMIWINDTGAFIVGSLLGRHRLFERISPKKSWEGFFGGLAFNIIAASVIALYGYRFFALSGSVETSSNSLLAIWIGLAVVVTLFATWGDLVESLIKRSLKIKDSGNIIPGHGGILDRIDSLLLVMPASLLYFAMIKMIF